MVYGAPVGQGSGKVLEVDGAPRSLSKLSLARARARLRGLVRAHQSTHALRYTL